MNGAIPQRLMPDTDTAPLGPGDEISCAVDRYVDAMVSAQYARNGWARAREIDMAVTRELPAMEDEA